MEDAFDGPPASLDDEDEAPPSPAPWAAAASHIGNTAELMSGILVPASEIGYSAPVDASPSQPYQTESSAPTSEPPASAPADEPPSDAAATSSDAHLVQSIPAVATDAVAAPTNAELPGSTGAPVAAQAPAAPPPGVILDPFSDPVLLREKALKYQKAAIKLRELYRETKAELATKTAKLAALASVADIVKGSVLSRPALRDGSPPFRIVAKVPAGTLMSAAHAGVGDGSYYSCSDEARVLRRSWLCLQPVASQTAEEESLLDVAAPVEEWAPEEAVLAALQLLVTLQTRQQEQDTLRRAASEGDAVDGEAEADREGGGSSGPAAADRRLYSPEGLIAAAPLLSGPADVARLQQRAEAAAEEFRRFRVRSEALQRQKDGEIASLREAAIKAAVAAASGGGDGRASAGGGDVSPASPAAGGAGTLSGLRGSGLAASLAGRHAQSLAMAVADDRAVAGYVAAAAMPALSSAAVERALEEARAANRALQARLERTQRQLAVASERERGWDAERAALRQALTNASPAAAAAAADKTGSVNHGDAHTDTVAGVTLEKAVVVSPVAAAHSSDLVTRAEAAVADALAAASAARGEADSARSEAAREAASASALRDALDAAREELSAYRRKAQGLLREKDEELASAKRQLRDREREWANSSSTGTKEAKGAQDGQAEAGRAGEAAAPAASPDTVAAGDGGGAFGPDSARAEKTPSAAGTVPHTPAPRERAAFPLSAAAASGTAAAGPDAAGLDASRAAYLRNVMLRYLSTPPTEGLGAPSSIRAALEPAIMTVLGLAPADVAAAKQSSAASGLHAHAQPAGGTPAGTGAAVTPAAAISSSRMGTGSASITGGKPLPPAPAEGESGGFLGSLISSFFSPAPATSSSTSAFPGASQSSS